MGKKFFLFLFVVGFSFNVFAQEENSTDVKRFSFGGALDFLPDGGGSGGFLEFGFLIFHNEKLDIRNHISISGTRIHDNDGVNNTLFMINERISLKGIITHELFRPYGYIEGGIGIYGTKSKEPFETPLAYNFGFGFGLDIFVSKDMSFLIEGGEFEYILDTQRLSTLKMTIGSRVYF